MAQPTSTSITTTTTSHPLEPTIDTTTPATTTSGPGTAGSPISPDGGNLPEPMVCPSYTYVMVRVLELMLGPCSGFGHQWAKPCI
jgi:hypothetical protein